MSNIRKSKTYTQKFRKAWLTYTDFRDWLEEFEDDDTKCRCKVCDIVLKAKLSRLQGHSNSAGHQKRFELYYNPSSIGEDIKDDSITEQSLVKLKCKGWKGVCVVCLRKNRRNLMPIFVKDPDGIMISDKISECSTFQIQFEMNIPRNICLECHRDLQAAYRFQKYCEKSRDALEKFIYQTNSTSETIEEFVETLEDSDNHRKYNQEKKICSPLQIANTTITRKICETYIKEEENDEDDESTVVGTFLNNDNFYVKYENDSSDTNSEDDYFEINTIQLQNKSKLKRENRKYYDSGEKAILICDICGNLHRDKYSLKMHMKRHFNIKSHVCEICNKAFFLSQQLNCHMRTHTGEKPYECRYCPKRYADYSCRQRHERTHTGERPYKCEMCGKGFAYPKCLKVHLKTHAKQNLQ